MAIVSSYSASFPLEERFDAAHLIVLIIDQAFLEDRPQAEAIIAKAIEEAQIDGKVLLPILWEACDWESTGLRHWPVLPRNGIPLSDPSWPSIEEAMRVAAADISAEAGRLARFVKKTDAVGGRVFSLLIGIDHYAHERGTGGEYARATNELAYAMERGFGARLRQEVLLDRAAHRAAVLERLQAFLLEAGQEDVLLFYFAGRGLARAPGSPDKALLFHDYVARKEEGMLRAGELRALFKRAARRRPSLTILFDTAFSGEGWIDAADETQFALSARDDEPIARGTGAGADFTKQLISILQESGGAITCRELTRRLRRRWPRGAVHYPCLVASQAAVDRLFLTAGERAAARWLELLAQGGYHSGPIDGPEATRALSAALDRFREDWDVEQEDDILERLEQLALLARVSSPRLLVIGQGREELNAALEALLAQLSSPFRLEWLRLENAMSQNMAYQSNIFSTDYPGLGLVDEAHFVVVFIDNEFINNTHYLAPLDRLQQRLRSDYLPVIPLLLERCPWATHPVAELPGMGLYRAKGRFEAPDWAITQGLETVREKLEAIALFHQAQEKREYLALCRQFDEEASISDIDTLGKKLSEMIKGIADASFIVRRLRADSSPGYVFGAAKAIEAKPLPEYFNPLLKYLQYLIEEDLLETIRLRVVYRLVMALEGIAATNERAVPVEERERARGALRGLLGSKRVELDRMENPRSSLAERIERALKTVAH
jgi:hypothetical protein